MNNPAKRPAALFGAALDFLDDPERVALKQAYLEARQKGSLRKNLPADPYDAIAPLLIKRLNGRISLHGKLELPGWLTPRPGPEDQELVRPRRYREFMDSGGPELVVRECQKKAASLLPSVPVMIGVDHLLSAGPIAAASAFYGPDKLAVVALDSHFDAVSAEARLGADPGFASESLCGAFLSGLIEQGAVMPSRLLVAGVSDFPGEDIEDTAYGRTYLSLLERGVRVYPRDEAAAPGFPARLKQDLSACPAEALYVTLDADAGAGSAMNAVRFLDAVGLSEQGIMEIAAALRSLLDAGRYRLCGLDVCEVDVHLLDLAGPEGEADRTAQTCAEFIASLLR